MSSTPEQHFHYPRFDKTIEDKVSDKLESPNEHEVLKFTSDDSWSPAIATDGFPANVDGVHVFATEMVVNHDGDYMVGFIDKPTHPANQGGYPGCYGMTGTALYGYTGGRYPSNVENFMPEITRKAKEIISILIVSNDGRKKEVQWIVD